MANRNLIRFDWAIKRLLRNKADYTVLEGFLSVLLEEDIKIINIDDSESNQEHADDKFNRVDILVRNSKGELVIIEIQNSAEVDYLLRMIYGVSKVITEQLNKGDRYDKICKVYHINIVYFKLGNGEDYVYHGAMDFRGIHNNKVLQLTEKQKSYFKTENVADLHPEYYLLCVIDFNDLAKDSLDEWIYYLKNTEIPDNFTARGLKEAREQLKYDNLSESEKRAYDHHLKQTRYEQNVVTDARVEGLIEGKAIGLEEGEAIGLEKGEVIGLTKKTEEVVINSYRNKISVDTIAVITNLNIEQVIEILKTHGITM